MRNQLFSGIILLGVTSASAQDIDSVTHLYGIRQNWGGIPLSRSDYPEIRGLLCNFKWKDIEPSDNVWNWQQLDSVMMSRDRNTPFQLMIFTKDFAPDWLFTTGAVPKVTEYNNNNDSVGFSPYFADDDYKFYFERMIDTVANHVRAYPDIVKKYLSIQACIGEQLDYIGYRNVDQARALGLDTQTVHVDTQYKLTSNQLAVLFKEFTWHYYSAYLGSGIPLLCNPSCSDANSQSNIYWVLDSLPGMNLRYAVPGKSFQINDELDRLPWLIPVLNSKHNGDYIRANSDLANNDVNGGWWKMHTTRNMFTLFASMLYYGLDFSDQMPTYIRNPPYKPAFDFFNKYAGEKDTSTAAHAMCALHDGLDASDSIRFPAATYGKVIRSNGERYLNIQNDFASRGALEMDTARAKLKNDGTVGAAGTNDVGWRIIPGNYKRYLRQLNAYATSVGYWNVNASNDTNSIYGRFGRGFDVANGKNALYFDIDNGFMHYAPLNSQSPVMISVTYLDSGNGSWQLFYDAQDSVNKPSIAVNCTNSGTWKTASITITDGYFGNRSDSVSDFYIRNTGGENVIFALVEFERPDAFVNNVGLFSSDSLSFDSVCTLNASVAKPVVISGAFLDGSDVVIGPFTGYKFSFFADSAFSDSLLISNYGTSFEDSIYVQFNPTDSVTYSGDCPISGGGVPNGRLPLAGIGIDSRPTLTAQVTNVSCFMAKDGSIDIIRHGGEGPYTYCWSNTGNFKDSGQDISNLSPSTYTVTVTSYAGCKMSASYIVTQPDPLIVTLVVDSMLCRNGTTTVHVSASGGTRPYNGTGDFVVSYGKQTYTVTDAHGCTDSESIYVNNGTGVPPAKPDPITGMIADATGVCGGGNFTYSISPVVNATSYTWLPPPNCSINSISIDGTQLVLTVPPDFTTDSLSVTADNGCGSSLPQKKYITTLPGKPGTISGPAVVSPLQTAITYSVSQVGSLKYVWTVPPGTTITSGQNTSAITVNWGNSPGNVTVKGMNSCGTSVANSFLNVTVLGNTLVASVGTLPGFDTICINGLSTSKYFNLAGSGLDGSNVVVKAVPGFKVSTANNGIYGDSAIISNYGSSIKQNVYVKFNPATAGSYNGSITTSGGGASAAFVGVSGEAVNSSPGLSANIKNVSCRGAADGAIDLSVSGGMTPFSYKWIGPGSYDSSAQDIKGLGPATYTVTVTSYVGCRTSASYIVTQPDALTLTLTADAMICKDANTIVHVRASGGTMPYSGTGDFTVLAGKQTFTVTDAHGCSQTQSIWVANGSLVAPNKPGPITGAYADSVGLCGGGQFKYRIDTVPTATSYTWIPPAGCSVGSVGGYGNQLVLIVPPGFVADTLRVTASNFCGTGVPQAKTLLAIPAKPGAISGPTSLTANQTGVVYSAKKPSAVRFNWKVPRDALIISGQGSGSIVVNWGTLSGNVSVKSKNDCGTSTYASTLSVTVGGAMAAQQQPQSVSSVSDHVIALPNPASNIVHISFAAREIYTYTIFLSDVNGKVVAEKTGITVKGENLVSFNVRNYANGIYLVTVMKENGEATRIKLLKD